MKITLMFRDLLKSLLSKPATEPFPNPEQNEPERLRGKLHWNPENCTGCQLCVKDCPSNALKLFVIDKDKKEFVLRYDVGRCTFCAQCVENCRFNCLAMAQDEWSLSDSSPESFIKFYGKEADVKHVLAESSTSDSESEN